MSNKHRFHLFAVSLLALAIAACAADEPVDTAAGSVQPDSEMSDPSAPTGAADAPAASSEAAAAADPATAARFDGYDAARFGMTADEVRASWGGELNGDVAADETCFYLSPVGQPSIAYFALMFGDGEFVRYSVANDGMTAPGGGRVGMDEADIQRLYGAGIERSGHKYVEGGEYLRIVDPADGDAALLFETDADGRVTEWRVGVPPYVDYVEGCA